ncbi:MAG: hypothetical protein LBF60_04870 [Treponema sp.]|jgi:hypothetical protein|nr:hypothetical protein [Treponema sp.]
MKRLFLFGLVFLSSFSLVYAQEREERRRGLYVDVGLGFGGVSYFGGGAKATADGFKETAEMRMTIDIQLLTIGWALMQNMYLVGTIPAVGDAYFDADMNQSQISVAMYGIGARYYPLPSKKYLQLGLDAGLSARSILSNNKEGDPGYGFSGRLSAAYDFDSTMTGITALLGGALMMNALEGDASLSYALFFKLAFK